jgi:hypothetical protein
MLSLMKQNVALNELESRVVPMILNWLVVLSTMAKFSLSFPGAILSRNT